MILARGFVIVSLLAVISSASASLLVDGSVSSGQQPAPTQQEKQERYFGPSKFAALGPVSLIG